MLKIIKNKIRKSIYDARSGFDKKIKLKKLIKNSDLTFCVKNFGKKNPKKKFYIIQRMIGGGLFSNLNYVIHHLKIADDLKCIPIIDMKNFPTKYNEKHKINDSFNSWNYYFKPINNYKLKDVYKSSFVIITDGKTKKHIEFDSFENLTAKHNYIFNKYIKIRKDIQIEAKKFVNKNFLNEKVLGVHFRGTDMRFQERHPFPPTKTQIINEIERQIKKNKYKKIFLVTEDIENLNFLKARFSKDILFYYNSFRSNKSNIFEQVTRKNHRYLLGKEHMIDMIILSKTDKIICSNSHLPDASRFISYPRKIDLIKIDNGNNSENILIAQFLWYFKNLLPSFIGGFKK